MYFMLCDFQFGKKLDLYRLQRNQVVCHFEGHIAKLCHISQDQNEIIWSQRHHVVALGDLKMADAQETSNYTVVFLFIIQ